MFSSLSKGWKGTLWTSWWPPTFPPCSSWPSPRSPSISRTSTLRPAFLSLSLLFLVVFWFVVHSCDVLVPSHVHALHVGVQVPAAHLLHEGDRVVASLPHPRPSHHLCCALLTGKITCICVIHMFVCLWYCGTVQVSKCPIAVPFLCETCSSDGLSHNHFLLFALTL